MCCLSIRTLLMSNRSCPVRMKNKKKSIVLCWPGLFVCSETLKNKSLFRCFLWGNHESKDIMVSNEYCWHLPFQEWRKILFFFFNNYIEFWEKLLFFPPFLHSVLIGCCSQLWGYLYGSGWVRVLQPPVLVLLWAVLQLSGCLPTFWACWGAKLCFGHTGVVQLV